MAVTRADPSALDTGTIGFRLAPRINAAGRLRRADAGLELLLTDDAARAHEIARELEAVNAERRAVEQRIVWEAEAQVAELGRAKRLRAGQRGLAPRRDRDRRLADRRAPPPADDPGRARGRRPAPARGAASPASTCSARSTPRPATWSATAGTAPPPGCSLRREQLDGVPGRGRAPRRRGPDPGAAGAGRARRRGRLGRRARARAGGGARGARAVRDGQSRSAAAASPGARFGDVRTMGEGRHARFSVSSGGVRARAVAFGCDGRLPGEPGAAVDATFKLERNVWNGAVEPRLVLRHAQPCAPAPIEVLGEPDDFCAGGAGRARGGARGPVPSRAGPGPARARCIDRRGESPLAVLRRRARGRRIGAGGVRRRPPPAARGCARAVGRLRAGLPSGAGRGSRDRLARFAQLVVLDPPSSARRARAAAGRRRVYPPGVGPSLSYALRSRCTSWSTDSVLRSSPSTGP